MKFRTDLVDEDVAKELVKVENTSNENLDISVVELDEESAKKYNRKKGIYSTINTIGIVEDNIMLEEDITIELIKLIKDTISYYKIKPKLIFVVGLGNKQITPDAIGPKAVEGLIVNNHIEDENEIKIIAIAPGVMGQTGMESANIVKSIVDSYNPDLVIAIDALATKSTKRLFKSIQLASSGIAPGSGVNNKRLELSYETLGCHVLAIGVPTVVDIVSIFNEYNIEDENLDNNFFLTSKEVDDLIKHTSIIISKAINISLLDLK